MISPYAGGAFGSRGSLTQRTALIALAAKRIGRPVKLVATRAQGFTIATHRAETRHHVQLGATREGRLLALRHAGWEVSSRPDDYSVSGTDSSTRLYACPNVESRVQIVHADRNTPGFMRAPPETPYLFALESAMDELAYALHLDPVQLRLLNDTPHEPIKGLPYTSRHLRECFETAAERFGWAMRNPAPRSMRDGEWLVGWGTATALYPTQVAAASVRVCLTADGVARVQTATHEIGTGVRTVMAIVTAERLGLDPSRVQVHRELSKYMWRTHPLAPRPALRQPFTGVSRVWSAAQSFPIACSTPSGHISSRRAYTRAHGRCACHAPWAHSHSGGSSVPPPPGAS